MDQKFKLSQFALTLQATCTAASVTLRQHSKSVYKSAACRCLCHSAPSGGVVTDKLGPHCGIFSVSFPAAAAPYAFCAVLRVIRFKRSTSCWLVLTRLLLLNRCSVSFED